MLTYRDLQCYDSMVKLVEPLRSHEQARHSLAYHIHVSVYHVHVHVLCIHMYCTCMCPLYSLLTIEEDIISYLAVHVL